MGVNVTVRDQCAVGNQIEIFGVFDLGTYVTGGVPFVSNDFKLTTLFTIDFPAVVAVSPTEVYLFGVIWSGNKRFFAGNALTMAEIANGTSLGSAWMHFRARGVK